MRTAVGHYNASLASLGAVELGSIVIKKLVAQTSSNGTEVDEVIVGNVIRLLGVRR